MTLQLVRVTPSLDPDDLLQELIGVRGDNAALRNTVLAQEAALVTAHSVILALRQEADNALALIERNMREWKR